MIIAAILGSLIYHLHSSFVSQEVTATTNKSSECACVIFRFDDFRNGYLEGVQMALMDFFITNNINMSLGLVMNQISNDSNLFQKIDEGYRKGLFELAVHGWDHLDYTNLTESEHETSLINANHKMNKLFGNYSKVYIPPFNLFNNITLSKMHDSHYDILSSAIYYDEPDLLDSIRRNTEATRDGIIHMPEMTDFAIYYNGTWVKVPLKFILGDIDFDIRTYGYSVVMFHPHNFAIQVNGSLSDVVDYNQLQSLNSLINAITNKNMSISTFSGVRNMN